MTRSEYREFLNKEYRLPTPAREYIEYYQKNPDGCVGLCCVHSSSWYIPSKWYTCHASGAQRPTSFFWGFIPTRFIYYNSKGIILRVKK